MHLSLVVPPEGFCALLFPSTNLLSIKVACGGCGQPLWGAFFWAKRKVVWPTSFSCREEGYEMLYWIGWGLGLLPAGDLLQHKGWKEANIFFLAENDDFANCFVIKINSEIEANWNVYSCIHLSKESCFFSVTFTAYYLWCPTKLGRCFLYVQDVSCILLEGDCR